MDKILFFDGYCSLCSHLVDQMIRIDKQGVLKFASLQGETAKKLLPSEFVMKVDVDTVLYLRQGQVFDRSTAILMSLRDLGGAWTMVSAFLLVPKFLRDLIYRLVARNRFTFFKRRETCRLPTASEKERLLN